MQASDLITPQFKTELKAALDVPVVGLDLIQQLFSTYQETLQRETILKALEYKTIKIPLLPNIEPALHGSPAVASIIGESSKHKLKLKKEMPAPSTQADLLIQIKARRRRRASSDSGSGSGSGSDSDTASSSSKSESSSERGSDDEVKSKKDAKAMRKAERDIKRKLYPRVNVPPVRSVLSNDMARLLQFDALFDLTITTADGAEVKAHQVVVFLRSPYFSPLIEVARATQNIAEQSLKLSPMVKISAPAELRGQDVRTYVHFLYTAEVMDPLKTYTTINDLLRLQEACSRVQCEGLGAICSLELQDRLAGEHQEICATIPKLDNLIKKLQQEKLDVGYLVNLFNRCLLWILELQKKAGLVQPLDLKVIGAQRLDTLIKLITAPEKERPKFTPVQFPPVHVTLAKELAAAYPAQRFADCVLTVGETEFKAHRCILSARSGYFAGAFTSTAYKESVEGRIAIPDFNSTVFASMLKYFYTSIPAASESREELFELFVSYDYFAPQSNELPRVILSMLSENLKKKLAGQAWKPPVKAAGCYVGPVPKTIPEALRRKICTYTVTGTTHQSQAMAHCNNCNLVNELVVCKPCMDVCHKGHSVSSQGNMRGFCDCGVKCKIRNPKTHQDPKYIGLD